MSGIIFLSENLVDEASLSLTGGTENQQFPLQNIKNEATVVSFRSNGNSAVIEFDLTQTREIDTVALTGNAIDGLQITTATYKTSVTTDFSGSPVNSITLDSENNIGLSFITEVNHRYVELTLTGNGTFTELSNIFIGKQINLPQNSLSIGTFTYRNDDRSRIQSNRTGQKFIDVLNSQKKINGRIEFCTKSEQETLDDMFIRHGRNKPLWMIVDRDSEAMNDGSGKLSIYAYLEQAPTWSADGGQLYSASIRTIQVI